MDTDPTDYSGFSENLVFKRFVERNMELAVEQMIDICRHLVSGLDLEEPESYADCFAVIGRAGVLPETKTVCKIFSCLPRKFESICEESNRSSGLVPAGR